MTDVMVRILQRDDDRLIFKYGRTRDPLRQTSAAHLHRFHGVVSVVMDRVPLVLGRGISKASDVDHVAVVEGNKHSEDAGRRVDWALKRMTT